MTERMFDEIDDVLPPEPNGDLVQWMEPRPLTVGPAGISLATAGAFALGALATVAVLAALHWLGPQRRAGLPRWVRRRRFE
ncbi:MAG: hypothetical protein JWP49_664 [Phenylobacterium sp.]|nr:hypothetical protein [Phenylobacterium sp.]